MIVILAFVAPSLAAPTNLTPTACAYGKHLASHFHLLQQLKTPSETLMLTHSKHSLQQRLLGLQFENATLTTLSARLSRTSALATARF